MTERADEAAAERLLARFGYGAGAGTDPGASADAATGAESDTTTARKRMGVGTGPSAAAATGRHAATDGAAMTAETLSDVPEALRRLLTAASAPAQPHELRGYPAARAAFVEAAPRSGRDRGRHSASFPFARIAGVKLAALAGALTVAGVAVAAEADVLPSSIQRVAHHMLGGVGVPDPGPETPTTTAGPGAGSPSSPSRPATTTGPGRHGSTSTKPGATSGGSAVQPGHGQGSTVGGEAADLCRAFVAASATAGNGDGKGTGPLPPGQLRRLADLAGGEQNIPAYCDRVLGPAPAPSASAPATPVPSPAASTDPSKTHPSHASTTPSSADLGSGHTSNASKVR
jgi:hypothetical protein